MMASQFWMGWKCCTADLEKPSAARRRKRRNLGIISEEIWLSVDGVPVAIWGEDKCQVLCQIIACGDVSWSTRIYVGSLFEQIDGDALAVHNKEVPPKRAYIHHFT